MYLDGSIYMGLSDAGRVCLDLGMANRHGLIAGASGTGKTVTMKVMAESFSDAGVPVFLCDVKGDVSGLCAPGAQSEGMEKRIDKMTPKQWMLWQIAGGVAVGAVCVGSLFILGQEMSAYSLILAAVLAILMPRYLERAWRRKLTTARYAMAAAMLVGLAVMAVVMLTRGGITK